MCLNIELYDDRQYPANGQKPRPLAAAEHLTSRALTAEAYPTVSR
jgi:hypothetical protein